MGSTTVFVNCTRSDTTVHLLEGIEGVYRYMGSIPPLRTYPVRGIKTYCNYLAIRDISSKKVVPSYMVLDFKTINIVELENGDLDVQGGAPESEQAQIQVYSVGERCKRFIDDLFKSHALINPKESNYSRVCSNESGSSLVSWVHLDEIGCLLWIKGLHLVALINDDGSSPCPPSQTRARTALELWESKEKVFKLQIDGSEAELKECSNHIFQWIIGFYTVVHGVLFTVVSQPESPFTCRKIYISYLLSAIVSFFTIAGVIRKLKIMEDLHEIIYEHKARLLAVCRWQSELKRTASDFSFESTRMDEYRMRKREWWQPMFLPLEGVPYTFVIVVCSAMLCYIMQLLQCN